MRIPPPRHDLRFSNTTGILPKKRTMWFIGVEVKQDTSAPPPKKILDPPLLNVIKMFTVQQKLFLPFSRLFLRTPGNSNSR